MPDVGAKREALGAVGTGLSAAVEPGSTGGDLAREIDPELAELSHYVMQKALDGGAQQAAVRAGQGQFVELKQRDGKIESSRASRSRGISLTLYRNQRYSSNNTSYLARPALEAFVERALALTAVLEPDPHRGLAAAELYGPTPGVDLDLWHPHYPGGAADDQLAWLDTIEGGVPHHPSLLSVRSTLTVQASSLLQLHSNGFRGEHAATRYYAGCTVTVCEPDSERRPDASAFAGACHLDDMPDFGTLGKDARERAMARLGARKVQSSRMVLIVENRTASRLLGPMISALGGHALDQKRSFLADSLGQKVGSALLDVRDEPLIPRGLGSCTFDGDGLAVAPRAIFEAGRVSTFLIGVYYSRKLGRPLTGGGTSNLIVSPGTRSLAELIRSVKKGVLVSGFLGGNSNPATGDFSLGIVGRSIDEGHLADAVSEVTVSGSHRQLWHQLADVGADPYPYGSWRLPSLLFEDVQFSGK